MTTPTDPALRSTVVDVLRGSERALNFRGIKAKVGASDWSLRMTLDYLVESGIVNRRGQKGVACVYWLSGREFDSGQPRGYDASALMQVWR